MLCGSFYMRWSELVQSLAALTSTDWRPILTHHLRSSNGFHPHWNKFSDLLQCSNSTYNLQGRIQRSYMGKTSKSLEDEYGPMTTNERGHSIFFKTVHSMRFHQFTNKRDTIYGFCELLSAVLPPGMVNPSSDKCNLAYVK